MLTLDKFEEASEIVKKATQETKLIYSKYFSEQTGNKVYLKPENMQTTGAYKVRGAYYKISTLSEEERQKGLITASAGNHAQGVAYAAKEFGAKAVIVMPTATPLIKVNHTKEYGAEVVLYGNDYDEACAHAIELAKEKGYIYVDTGAMYRAMAVYFLQEGISPQDTEKIRLAAQNADVSICYEDGIQQVYLNGSNVTDRLREEAVGNMASVSSAVREVRARLLDLQRNLAKEADVIMDGRDIGTNILPNADVKIYLTASVKTRADRRYKELTEKGISCSYEEIAEDIKKRDERDMSRETAPLKQAEDAILIDSSDMSIEEVVHAICRQCK